MHLDAILCTLDSLLFHIFVYNDIAVDGYIACLRISYD